MVGEYGRCHDLALVVYEINTITGLISLGLDLLLVTIVSLVLSFLKDCSLEGNALFHAFTLGFSVSAVLLLRADAIFISLLVEDRLILMATYERVHLDLVTFYS